MAAFAIRMVITEDDLRNYPETASMVLNNDVYLTQTALENEVTPTIVRIFGHVVVSNLMLVHIPAGTDENGRSIFKPAIQVDCQYSEVRDLYNELKRTSFYDNDDD
jgi:hypothetical protein